MEPKPRSLRRAGVLLAAAMLAACASAPPRITHIVEPGFAPPVGATFAWQPVARERAEELDPRVDNDIVRGLLQRAIERALLDKGYRAEPDPARADLLVSFRVGVRDRREERQEVRSAPAMPSTRIVCGARGCVPLTVWGWYGPPTVSTRTIEYTEGGVMVDLVDRASGRLGWRGTVSDRLHGGGLPDQATVDDAMRAALATLPAAGATP
jgi:hypothetical protein